MSAIRTAAALIAILAALSLPLTAFAAQPVSYPLNETSTDVIDCGGFEATLDRRLTGTVTEFSSTSGDVIRVQATAQMRGSVEGNGQVIPLAGDLLVVIDLVRGTFAYNGVVLLGTDPGSGIQIQDTGRFLADFNDTTLLIAGPHDAIELGADAFCQAVA